MNNSVQTMLSKYQLRSEQDFTNALKEIIQEIALLGLWRAKFYEHAAFYGGSALRILYQLDRFSEDLDFSLLKPNRDFNLEPYNQAITDELQAFGFEVEVKTKEKKTNTAIESAFIKANTKIQLMSIHAPASLIQKTHAMHHLKIKMEVDTDPPSGFETEVKTLLQPIPFSVKSYVRPDLFAGKIHALLCRPWKARVKGRDWYDFIWYIAQRIPLNISHLRQRLIQTKAWDEHKSLTDNAVIQLLREKIQKTDFLQAKLDISPFIHDQAALSLWSTEFFTTLLDRLTFVIH
ncbi:MAG: nucleotidyl transferase AbiEii/AbiGii toxin family protein [Legionellaceae bacterium]|nr:nucleotidyl transferase AbiEii/AbiGii toxin family protein [Legionellaceae bacterium]